MGRPGSGDAQARGGRRGALLGQRRQLRAGAHPPRGVVDGMAAAACPGDDRGDDGEQSERRDGDHGQVDGGLGRPAQPAAGEIADQRERVAGQAGGVAQLAVGQVHGGGDAADGHHDDGDPEPQQHQLGAATGPLGLLAAVRAHAGASSVAASPAGASSSTWWMRLRSCQSLLVSCRLRSEAVSVMWIGIPGRPPSLTRKCPRPGGSASSPDTESQAGGSCQLIKQLLLGVRERDRLGEHGHLGGGQPAADDHAGALDEAARLHAVLGVGEGHEVAHGVRAHRDADALGAVQAGERVDAVDHPLAGAQRAPQLVEDHEVVPARLLAGVGERVGDVDGAEAVGPAGHQRGALEREVGVVDRGDVEHDRDVAAHRHGRLAGEDLAEPAVRQQAVEGDLQGLDDVVVADALAAVHRGQAQVLGAVVDDLDEVGQHGDPGRALIEDPQRAVQDDLLAVDRSGRPGDGDQGRDHRVPAPERIGQDLGAGLARQAVSGGDGLAGVQDVEVPAAAADPDHLAAHGLDQVDVVGLEVAEDEREDAVGGQAGRDPAQRRAFAQAREAEQVGAGVADDVGLKPADRVRAQRGAGVDVAPERDADHRQPDAGRERPQAAHLDGGAAPLLGRLDVAHLAAPRPEPAARAGVAHRRRRRRRVVRASAPESHSAIRILSGTLRCAGRTTPSGSAAANAESWEP